MNFKTKAKIQRLFSVLPKGENINFFFQKNITKSLPISDEDFVEKLRTVKKHFDNYMEFSENRDLNNSKYYEFGTGYDLVIPIGIRSLGFEELTCIDIRELLFPELINDAIRRFNNIAKSVSDDFRLFPEIPEVTKDNFREVALEYMNIKYRAPLDARNTGIESGSIDFILSNATMEHIPEIHLYDILKECHRILKKGGIMSNAIDYRDHWSFFDRSISVYNYLQYSDSEWKKLNPSIMYQNRMRHRDHIEKINKAGFKIISEKKDMPDESELIALDKIKTDEHFSKNYSREELSVKSSMIVLKKM
ncbi:MAG: class I SAM-dependent methyltransferase [Bacteroidetes bacterium]|nr:class I SAM-dependent methyltransferase [Bacteroidota bacterium]